MCKSKPSLRSSSVCSNQWLLHFNLILFPSILLSRRYDTSLMFMINSQYGSVLIMKFNQTNKMVRTVQLLLLVQYLNLWRHCLLTCGSECRHISPIVVLPQVNFPLIMFSLSDVKNAIKLEINNEDGDNIMKREQPTCSQSVSKIPIK